MFLTDALNFNRFRVSQHQRDFFYGNKTEIEPKAALFG